MEGLLQVIRRLLDPNSGCPWDLKQTPQTIRLYLLEETYELLEAIENGSPHEIMDELGDCFFLLCFLAFLFERQGLFNLNQILDRSARKMIARHPHIFGNAPDLKDAEAVRVQWHQIKTEGKKKAPCWTGVPANLPALLRTHRLSERAGKNWIRLGRTRIRPRVRG